MPSSSSGMVQNCFQKVMKPNMNVELGAAYPELHIIIVLHVSCHLYVQKFPLTQLYEICIKSPNIGNIDHIQVLLHPSWLVKIGHLYGCINFNIKYKNTLQGKDRTYLVSIHKESKHEENQYKGKENWSDHSINKPKKEIQLQIRQVLGQANTAWIHCFLSVLLSLHQKYIFQMVYDKVLQAKDFVCNTRPSINHYVCHKECGLHWDRNTNCSRNSDEELHAKQILF